MYYFASDMHLGHGDAPSARHRENLLVQWLDYAAKDATEIYLLGDVFDFWFEWGEVVPAGHVRLLGKLAELSDRGIEIHLFTGNHDMWQRGYLEHECGVRVHYSPEQTLLAGHRVWIGHGDNLNIKGQPMLQLMNTMFRSRVVRALFSWLIHPTLSMRFGKWWSGNSRKAHGSAPNSEQANRALVEYAEQHTHAADIDLFIFGHTHAPAHYSTAHSEVYFLGEWIGNDAPTYGVLDAEGNFTLRKFNNQ
ncbi:MAG: UDP-2,3-diacylglucosamine diphosphatase [Rikenellaceae bacterium]|nr:UDP-2,3-diacylglucosamine diphosphatase [Rikenellaceae bacterium]